MSVTFFRIQLSVQPQEGGEAKLKLPNILQELNYQFVIVKDGGEEGIVKVEAPDASLRRIEQDNRCETITPPQVETLKAEYPAPKLKQKYRMLTSSEETDVAEISGEPFAVDEQGDRIVDTWQTVRSGFYLIDVPILSGAS